MTVSGYSYGASVPSLKAQQLSALNGSPAWRRRQAFNSVASVLMDVIHPGNFSTLPPSPKEIILKGVQVGLVTPKDRAYLIMFD